MHILRALKSANDLLGVFSVKLFAASEVGLRALNPFCNSIVSLLVQLSKCVVDGLILPTEKSLQSLGYDTRPTVDALKMFSLAVKQTCKQLFKVLETLFPNISPTRSTYLIRATGIFVAIYLLVPFVIQMLAHAVRGYKGELSALQALDMVLKRGYLLIDIRTEKEKFKSGIPSLPQNVMNSILFVPIEDLSLKFKGQLRDYRRAEAEVAAIKISFLRRINKSSKLVILDRYGDVAKLVARSLTRFGFRNSWVITDGFDGGRGWVQSRLSTAPRAGFAQMFSPTRLISEGAKKIFPSGRDIDITPQ
ncbi:hypothetical protein L7F22_041548 [Adiantum nelumboides]|nr:hypothetical protein [Adiantum nelumboides]